MNIIIKHPVNKLGYNFVEEKYIPAGKDEYYLRYLQNTSGTEYRKLSAHEIEVLVRNRNTSDDWNKIFVSAAFNPELVKNCKFYGLIRIGNLESFTWSFITCACRLGCTTAPSSVAILATTCALIM